MANPSVNPQEVFRSNLPVGTSLLVLFVPSKDRDGNPIDQEFWVDEVLTALGRLFRGATAYPRGRGIWRDDERGGVLLKEEPVIVFSYVAQEALTSAALGELYRTLSRMGREANQGEIGVVIDGQYYGITEYAAE
ncbi:MAG: hypothetical protein HYS12_14275 [Planctomycetes bacterium]|nr:hypothetical protein [Planctomycetota bacterium]